MNDWRICTTAQLHLGAALETAAPSLGNSCQILKLGTKCSSTHSPHHKQQQRSPAERLSGRQAPPGKATVSILLPQPKGEARLRLRARAPQHSSFQTFLREAERSTPALPLGLLSCKYGGAVGVTFPDWDADSRGERSSTPSAAMTAATARRAAG